MIKENKKNKRNNKEIAIKVGKIVLTTIAVSGFLSMALVAPNALQSIKLFSNDKKKYNFKYRIQDSIARLKNQGLIEFVNKNGKIFAQLTDKGHQRLLKYRMEERIIKKPKKWDKKWRVIIFDIYEYKRFTRDSLRRQLVRLGFIKLQNSVWVYPYECEDLMFMLKTYFHLGKDVLYMTVDKIENDKWLKKNFGLIV